MNNKLTVHQQNALTTADDDLAWLLSLANGRELEQVPVDCPECAKLRLEYGESCVCEAHWFDGGGWE